MISIDFDKLTELCNALIQYKAVLQNNLDMAIKQGNNWTFSRQQFAKCPPLVQLEDDYRTLRKKREKILSDIDKTISCINYVISVYRGTEMAIAELANQIIERNGLVSNTNRYLSMFKDISECVADGVGGINEITDDVVEVIKEEDSDTDNTVLDKNENATSLNGELFYNEFLAKSARDDYKSDEKKYGVGGWQSFWDDTTPLSDYMIFGHEIPVVPSTSDLIGGGLSKISNNPLFKSDVFDYAASGLGLSALGTVAGNSDRIVKEAWGYTEDNIIKILPKDSLAEIHPYESFAKVTGNMAKGLTVSSIGIDVANTWTADSGNTRLQRLEKSAIQVVGDGICYGTGKGTEAMAVAGFVNPEFGGWALIPAAAGIDAGVSAGVTAGEDWACKKLNIK
jgi:hypothetical protein